MSKSSKQVKITSLFGPGPSKSPKYSENTSTDIIDESSEVAECSSKGNCLLQSFHDHNDIKFKISKKKQQKTAYSRRTLLDLCAYKR